MKPSVISMQERYPVSPTTSKPQIRDNPSQITSIFPRYLSVTIRGKTDSSMPHYVSPRSESCSAFLLFGLSFSCVHQVSKAVSGSGPQVSQPPLGCAHSASSQPDIATIRAFSSPLPVFKCGDRNHSFNEESSDPV